MAKQIGSVRLKGTIGGINFYNSKNGGDLARAGGGGYNGEAIKKKESMFRVRENASEFGHCSTVKKNFKIALIPFLCIRKDGQLHGRMMQLFTKLKTMDSVNIRGERRVGRGIEKPLGKQLMKSFVFTPSCEVKTVLGASISFDFGNRKLRIGNFDIKNVKFPSGATHIALTLGLLHFDFDSLDYQLKNSAPLYMDKSYSGTSFEMEVDTPEVGGTGLAVLGMKFYQEVEDTFYLLKSANAVGVEILGIG